MVKLKTILMKNEGMSILSVMVVLSVTLVLATAGYQSIANRIQESGHFKAKASLTSLKSYVRDSFNCQKTLDATPAFVVGSSYDVMSDRSSPNHILVKNTESDLNYTKIGRYSLRATCVACPTCPSLKKLLIEVAVFDDSGSFAKDALTKKDLAWVDLFDKEQPLECTLP